MCSGAFSTSKIIKITAIKKNCDEKGSRAEFFGSYPHSNGDLFSRSLLIFFEINVAYIIMTDDSKRVTPIYAWVFLSLTFPHRDLVNASPLPLTCYMPQPSHSSPFDRPNNIG
jgi:hypothetical protein